MPDTRTHAHTHSVAKPLRALFSYAHRTKPECETSADTGSGSFGQFGYQEMSF